MRASNEPEWVAVPRWWFDQKCGGSDAGNNENLISWRAGNNGVRVMTVGEVNALVSQRNELAAIVSVFEAIAWDGCPRRREQDDLCIRARAALKAMRA